MGLSAGAAIRENPGLLLMLAAASAADAAAASTTTDCPSLPFYVGHISYWYDHRNITTTVVTASVGTGFASHCCMPRYE